MLGYTETFSLQKSGLSCWIGEQLLGLQQLPHPLIVFIVTVIVAVVTEVISNVATTTLFLPVLASLVRLRILAPNALSLQCRLFHCPSIPFMS